jgi:hypothetical protein
MTSPVSTTPMMHFLQVVLTPVRSCITGVVDNFASINATGDACIAGVVDIGDAPVGPLAVRQCL